jgi:hypothetical protein
MGLSGAGDERRAQGPLIRAANFLDNDYSLFRVHCKDFDPIADELPRLSMAACCQYEQPKTFGALFGYPPFFGGCALGWIPRLCTWNSMFGLFDCNFSINGCPI